MTWIALTILACLCIAVHGQSDAEVADFSDIIWEMDVQNNQMPDSEYEFINGRGYTFFNEDYLELPTYAALVALLDNYENFLGTPEPNCPSCLDDEDAFIDEIMDEDNSPIMMALWEFLRDHGRAANTVEGFKTELKEYWFQRYERDVRDDSGGFEHVFVGELDSGSRSVGGFHSWIKIYLEEKAGNIEYTEDQRFCQPNQPRMSLDWYGYDKAITSIALGVSPEYEIAILTLCFATQPSSVCYVRMAGYDVNIQTWTMNGVSPTTIGSAYFLC